MGVYRFDGYFVHNLVHAYERHLFVDCADGVDALRYSKQV
jgi:hypothetical protein